MTWVDRMTVLALLGRMQHRALRGQGCGQVGAELLHPPNRMKEMGEQLTEGRGARKVFSEQQGRGPEVR